MSRWVQFGRWPSTHDLDIVLDAPESEYRRLETLAGEYGLEVTVVPIDKLPMSDQLRRLGQLHGVPLDVFLSPSPGSLSVAAWIEPPWTTAVIDWRGTFDRDFFPNLD